MNIKKCIAAALSAVILLSLAACSVDLSSTAEESRTVLTIDGWEVPYEMYRYAVLMSLRDQAELAIAGEGSAGDGNDDIEMPSGTPAEVIPKLCEMLTDDQKAAVAENAKKYAVETLVNIYSLFTAAKEAGLDPFGDMMNARTDMEMEELRVQIGGDKEFLETVKPYFMNNSVYSVLTRYELVFDQLYYDYVRSGVIDASGDAVIAHMKSDEAVRVKQILISFERHSYSEAREIAESVLAEVEKYVSDAGYVDEAEFDSLTDKYGEDLFMFRNRDGYYIPHGYTDERFEEAAFALAVGKVSGVVRTAAGYSILMRAEKDPEFIETNVEMLSEICLSGIYRSMLDKYYDAAEISESDGLSDIDIYNMQ